MPTTHQHIPPHQTRNIIGFPTVPSIPFPNPFLLPGTTSITPIYFGKKRFELTDWLGNIRVVINDKKTPVNSGSVTVSYKPQVMSVSDYYSFGSQISERSYDPVKPLYRFGFNTQEKLSELNKDHYTAKFWEYDSRLGRRWNVDPKPKYHESSYSILANNPIWFNDINGLDTSFADNQARKDFNDTYKGISNEINRLQITISNIEQKALDKGWSDKKLARKTENLRDRLNDLNKVKKSFDEIIKSSTIFVYSTDVSNLKGKEGETSQTGDNEVTIFFKAGQQGSLVHETRHAYGFILKEWNRNDGYDWEDERQAYLYQMIWDASSVQKKIENAVRQKYPNNPERWSDYGLNDMIQDLYRKVNYPEFKQHYVK